MDQRITGRILVVAPSTDEARAWIECVSRAGAACVSEGDADAAIVVGSAPELRQRALGVVKSDNAIVCVPPIESLRVSGGSTREAPALGPDLIAAIVLASERGRSHRLLQEVEERVAQLERERDDLSARLRELYALPDIPAADSQLEIQGFLTQIAAEIERSTDYGAAIVVVFDAEPPFRPEYRAISPSVPASVIDALGSAAFPPDQGRRLADMLRSGKRIGVETFGESVYFSTHETTVIRNLEAVVKLGGRSTDAVDAGSWGPEDELVTPIVGAHGDHLGFISVDNPQSGRAPDERSVLPLLVYARRIAWTVERARADRGLVEAADRARVAAVQLEEANNRLRETAQEAEALYRASKLLLDTSSPERLYEQIVEVVRAEFGYTQCTLLRVEPASGELVDALGEEGHWHLDEHALALAREVVINREVRTLESAVTVDAFEVTSLDSEPTRSALAVPLVVESVAIAVLMLQSPRNYAFDERDERILTSFGERAALALHQARLHETVSLSLRREAVVRRISATIRQSLDLQQVFEATVEMLGRELRVDRCVLYQVAGGQMNQVAQFTAPGIPRIDASFKIDDFRDLYDAALRDGEVIFEDVLTDRRVPKHVREHYLKPIGTRGMLFFPIMVRDVMRGVLVLSETSGPKRWTEHQLSVSRDVSEQVAIAIHQAQLFEWVSRAKIEWESTFDAISDGIFIFDTQGKLARLNRTGSELAEISFDSIGHLRCCELLKTSGTSGTSGCAVEEALASGRRLLTNRPAGEWEGRR